MTLGHDDSTINIVMAIIIIIIQADVLRKVVILVLLFLVFGIYALGFCGL